MNKRPLFFEMKRYIDDGPDALRIKRKTIWSITIPSSKYESSRVRMGYYIAPRHMQILDDVLLGYGSKDWHAFYPDFFLGLFTRGWTPGVLLVFREGQPLVKALMGYPHTEMDYLIGSFALSNGKKANGLVSFIPINYKKTLQELSPKAPVLAKAWKLLKDAHEDKFWIAVI